MIGKTGLALLVAGALFSAQASAAAPSSNVVLQQCFKTLSHAQLQIWKNISSATLQSCKLFEHYYLLDDEQGFWNAIEVLRAATEASINGIEGKARVEFATRNCASYHYAYSDVTFDRWGFSPENEFPFDYAYLCGFWYGQE